MAETMPLPRTLDPMVDVVELGKVRGLVRSGAALDRIGADLSLAEVAEPVASTAARSSAGAWDTSPAW